MRALEIVRTKLELGFAESMASEDAPREDTSRV
jgi:hypothetical protein